MKNNSLHPEVETLTAHAGARQDSTPEQAAPELLPCPFCGGPAAFRGAAIRCTSFTCNASMSPVWTTAEIRKAKCDHAEKLRIAIEQTAERWNRREAVDMGECAAFFAGYEAGEARRADLAAPSAQPVRFGAGNWVVVTGTFNECPALFIEPSKTPGKVGESAEKEGIPRDRLIPGALVFTFPTPEQARAVADAICCPAPSAPAEVEGLVEMLNKRADWIGNTLTDPPKAHPDAVAMRKAATTLTALQAENERLRGEVATLKRTYNQLFDACTAEQARAENAERERDEWQWRDMKSAPTNGKHVILAIPTPGGFVRNVEGAFMNGRWMNALDLEVEPLCWFPKSLIPDRFLPWTDDYAKLKGEA